MGGAKATVIWPYGFYARFTPRLVLYAGNGTIIARDGDYVVLGGGLVDDTDQFGACTISVTRLVWPTPSPP